MRRGLFLLTVASLATACPEPTGSEPAPSLAGWPFDGATTVTSHVQLGWSGAFDRWLVDPPCRPDEAEPPGILAPAADGRWTAVAIGQTRVPCGGRDAIALHVSVADHLVISAPEVVQRGDVFSVHVTAHDRDGELLQRNDEAASWELAAGLEPGRRTGCMDIRSSTGDDALVQATAPGTARIVVTLSGRKASADVRVAEAAR